MNDITEKQVIEKVREHIHDAGVRAFARECGVAPSTISRIARGKLPPTEKVLGHLGYERIVIYRPVKKLKPN